MSDSAAATPGGRTLAGRSEFSLGIAATTLAVTAWGASSVVAKIIDMGALALIAYRFLLFAIVMTAVLTARRVPITRLHMRHSIWGGVTLGIDAGLFFTAVKFTTVANATIINALQIVIVSFVSAKLYGERMPRRDIGYAGLAMVGVAVVALESASSENWSLGGDLAAIGALFGWSAYFIATRHARDKVDAQQYTVCVAIYVGLMNLPFAAIFGQDLSWPTGESWMWLVVMAFGSGVLGHTAMNWSLRHVPLWLASTLTLLIPVVASGLAWLIFDEALSVLQMVAIAVVVAALAMIVRNQSRPRIGGVPAAESGPAATASPLEEER
ncbi:MAG: DMT family transporter [bacterium]|nr:DMT family transporter [bacterium]